jgi:hypothetical protein
VNNYSHAALASVCSYHSHGYLLSPVTTTYLLEIPWWSTFSFVTAVFRLFIVTPRAVEYTTLNVHSVNAQILYVLEAGCGYLTLHLEM